MTWSNLFPNASALVNAHMQHIVLYFQPCSNSAYPMHSGERYRTVWVSGYLIALAIKSLLSLKDRNFFGRLVFPNRDIHSAGTVLPFSSAAYNVTTRIGDRMHMCWRFRVFCSKHNVILFRFRAWSAFIFSMYRFVLRLQNDKL